MVLIHKKAVSHIVFTVKVSGSVTESLRRQWRFALTRRELVALVGWIVYFIHVTLTAHRR